MGFIDHDQKIIWEEHFLTSGERLEGSIKSIEAELAQRLEVLRADGKLLEAQRLEQLKLLPNSQ